MGIEARAVVAVVTERVSQSEIECMKVEEHDRRIIGIASGADDGRDWRSERRGDRTAL